MQRESDKQSRAHDEHLRKERNDLVGGGKAVRAGDSGAAPREAPVRRPEPPSRAMSPAEVARRAELTRHLPPSVFPADRRRLLAHLRNKKAPASVVEAVSGLPEGQEFRTIGEVVRAAGLRAGR